MVADALSALDGVGEVAAEMLHEDSNGGRTWRVTFLREATLQDGELQAVPRGDLPELTADTGDLQGTGAVVSVTEVRAGAQREGVFTLSLANSVSHDIGMHASAREVEMLLESSMEDVADVTVTQSLTQPAPNRERIAWHVQFNNPAGDVSPMVLEDRSVQASNLASGVVESVKGSEGLRGQFQVGIEDVGAWTPPLTLDTPSALLQHELQLLATVGTVQVQRLVEPDQLAYAVTFTGFDSQNNTRWHAPQLSLRPLSLRGHLVEPTVTRDPDTCCAVTVTVNGRDFGGTEARFVYHEGLAVTSILPRVVETAPAHGVVLDTTGVPPSAQLFCKWSPVHHDEPWVAEVDSEVKAQRLNSTAVLCPQARALVKLVRAPTPVHVTLREGSSTEAGTTVLAPGIVLLTPTLRLQRVSPLTVPHSMPHRIELAGSNFVQTDGLQCQFQWSMGDASWTRRTSATVLSAQALECSTAPLDILSSLPADLALQSRFEIEVTVTQNFGATFGQDTLRLSYLALPRIATQTPSFSTDKGGTPIIVRGTNFFNTSQALCRFGESVVEAYVESPEQLQCTAPPTPYVPEQQRILLGEPVLMLDELAYSFSGTCSRLDLACAPQIQLAVAPALGAELVPVGEPREWSDLCDALEQASWLAVHTCTRHFTIQADGSMSAGLDVAFAQPGQRPQVSLDLVACSNCTGDIDGGSAWADRVAALASDLALDANATVPPAQPEVQRVEVTSAGRVNGVVRIDLSTNGMAYEVQRVEVDSDSATDGAITLDVGGDTTLQIPVASDDSAVAAAISNLATVLGDVAVQRVPLVTSPSGFAWSITYLFMDNVPDISVDAHSVTGSNVALTAFTVEEGGKRAHGTWQIEWPQLGHTPLMPLEVEAGEVQMALMSSLSPSLGAVYVDRVDTEVATTTFLISLLEAEVTVGLPDVELRAVNASNPSVSISWVNGSVLVDGDMQLTVADTSGAESTVTAPADSTAAQLAQAMSQQLLADGNEAGPVQVTLVDEKSGGERTWDITFNPAAGNIAEIVPDLSAAVGPPGLVARVSTLHDGAWAPAVGGGRLGITAPPQALQSGHPTWPSAYGLDAWVSLDDAEDVSEPLPFPATDAHVAAALEGLGSIGDIAVEVMDGTAGCELSRHPHVLSKLCVIDVTFRPDGLPRHVGPQLRITVDAGSGNGVAPIATSTRVVPAQGPTVRLEVSMDGQSWSNAVMHTFVADYALQESVPRRGNMEGGETVRLLMRPYQPFTSSALALGGMLPQCRFNTTVVGATVERVAGEATAEVTDDVLQFVCSTPPSAWTGTVTASVSTNGLDWSSGEETCEFEYRPPVELLTMAPLRGPLFGGTLVALHGGGFPVVEPSWWAEEEQFAGYSPVLARDAVSNPTNAEVVVRVGGQLVRPEWTDGETLWFRTPPVDAPQRVPVEVTMNGQDYTVEGLHFEYEAQMFVSKVEPQEGPYTGHTTLTVTGGVDLREQAEAEQGYLGAWSNHTVDTHAQSNQLQCRIGATRVPAWLDAASPNTVHCETPGTPPAPRTTVLSMSATWPRGQTPPQARLMLHRACPHPAGLLPPLHTDKCLPTEVTPPLPLTASPSQWEAHLAQHSRVLLGHARVYD
jgi:hypothetical protein